MSKKLGKQTLKFDNAYITSSSSVGGQMEYQGPLASEFDELYQDQYMGKDTWEQAELFLMERSVDLAIKKANIAKTDIDYYIAGDLLNQNISAAFSARNLGQPFLGIYGACSTSMEGLAIASTLIDGGYGKYALAATSSHNATAERQYRYPTEYGGQKPLIAQYTVTGAGAIVVSTVPTDIQVTYATIGKVQDLGVKNPFDMGTAMAPAAADTIATHLRDINRKPDDYDLIMTGDLASVGHPIAKELLKKEGIILGNEYNDSGLLIYDRSRQEVFSGGSGCASCATVTYGYVMNQLLKRKLNKVLIVATGALLSPVSYMQGESIPCIAHAVAIERKGNN
ncbi:stage V sporulation protein AD [Desulfuribacillus alkaliarsenatis]|uniref:Stage V sporulation protein AD n=1 Tax=Desulfuribacillus alkaliarsenatis TaxID=766136 RepID=A0A1E5G5W2_9FIRM|nr:stage V sporulation protein AD [Desulfuribacillus alkaliarsenatis]OEF98485.1 stage V sporulation protein AD [Desulfuribacillus alkaliarsenatis]